jgi:predicted enzyme related to lactoylglutathione lyase
MDWPAGRSAGKLPPRFAFCPILPKLPPFLPMSCPKNPVGWFEIYVQNLERAQAFYEKTFQVQLQLLPSPVIRMLSFPGTQEQAGSRGALVHAPGQASGRGGTLVYFSCADCAVEAARAAQNGGKVFKEKFSIGQYGFIALVVDPDGNLIGLHSMA